MGYIQLKNQIFKHEGYSIVPYRKQDLMLIKQWRNEQINILRQNIVLTDSDQINYYEKHIIPSFSSVDTPIILFSLLLDEQCIGYGGLTNINWQNKCVELSFLVDPERSADKDLYSNDFSSFIALMKKVTFEELDFNRMFVETYDIRPLHISILEHSGFLLEGRMREHIKINGKFVDSLIHGFIRRQHETER